MSDLNEKYQEILASSTCLEAVLKKSGLTMGEFVTMLHGWGGSPDVPKLLLCRQSVDEMEQKADGIISQLSDAERKVLKDRLSKILS